MKLQTVYISYVNLSQNLKNQYDLVSHHEIINPLRNAFPNFKQFFTKYGEDFSLGFFISTMRGIKELQIRKPSVSRKMKIVDYSIFLPDEINDLNHYIDLVFEGIGIVLAKFNVPSEDVEKMKVECKKELNLS